MIRHPKATFIGSGHRAEMEKISQNESFLVACDYAELILAAEMTSPLDPAGLPEIIGARRVLEILKTIADVPKETKIKPTQLNYNA